MTAEVVVVTASAGTFPGLAEALRELEVAVEEHPLLDFAPPTDWSPVDDAVRRLTEFEAVAVTSPRASAAFAGRLVAGGAGRGSSVRPRYWASGPATAEPLRALVADVRMPAADSVGTSGAGVALAGAMLAAGVRGPVLFPCGEFRRDELPAMLRARGVAVHPVVCYRTVLAAEGDARTAVGRARILVVASPRVAELVARASPRDAARPALLAVGPTTAAAARAAGWEPAAVATQPTEDALVAGVRGLLAPSDPEL